MLGIQKSRTSPWHPAGNGGIERWNRSLKQLLLAHTDSERDDWDLTLPWCLWAYRGSSHSTTGVSPAQAIYGREFKLPLDFSLDIEEETSEETPEYLRNLAERMTRIWNAVENRTRGSQEHQKQIYDRRVAGPRKYEVGQEVMLWEPISRPGQCRKLTRPWSGPWIIVRQ